MVVDVVVVVVVVWSDDAFVDKNFLCDEELEENVG